MASNYTVKISGTPTDLDLIFKARTSSARADVGIKKNGTDLAQLYEKIKYSPAQEINFNTGFKTGGTDLRYIFVDINYV